MGVNPKIRESPPNPWNFHRVFHEINHPFGGFPPILGNTHIQSMHFLASDQGNFQVLLGMVPPFGKLPIPFPYHSHK